MEFHQIAISLNLFLVIIMGFSCSSQSRTFYVGGKDGWVADPSENYNHWAERNRFQVNDSLIFKYKEGLESVLEVSKDDYYKCNKENPIKTLKDGESEFKFQRSGLFHFISGYAMNCEKGQKLIVLVLFPRGHGGAATTTHKAAPPPAVATPPPSPSPSEVPAPVSAPAQAKSPAPAPAPYDQGITHHHEYDDHFAPAPAPSAASVSGGGLLMGSLLGFSMTVTVVLSCLF